MATTAPAAREEPARRARSVVAARGLALLAGGGDAATGALLVIDPATVLALLGAPHAAPWLLPWRWIGVFVSAVGLAYLYPFLLRPRSAPRLPVVFEVTAVARGGVSVLVGGALVGGALPAGWWVVAATDGGIAAAQLVLLARGGCDAGP